MKLRTWLAGVMVAVFLLGMLPPATADEHRGLGDYDRITSGTMPIGGAKNNQIGSASTIQTGWRMVTGIRTITGTIAIGGRRMTRSGHTSIIAIGSSVLTLIRPRPLAQIAPVVSTAGGR